jgi:hypothetical protein
MEGFTMARQSTREYLQSIYHRYQHAGRAEKTDQPGVFVPVALLVTVVQAA